MTIKEIEDLLTRYEEGTTNRREEHLLREFFLGPEVPPHLQEYRAFFRFARAESREKPSSGLGMKISARLHESLTVQVTSKRRRLVYTFSIAASILLLAGLIFTFRTSLFRASQPYGTITDPQLAYTEASNALLLISGNLNRGLARMDRMRYLDQGIRQARLLSQYDKYQPISINPDGPEK
jgi:hypothetical protein